MFVIKKEAFPPFEKIKLINLKTKEYVSIIPAYGANVNEIVLRKEHKLFHILDGDKNAGSLIQNDWFKGAVLIPFANRIKDGKYSFEGKNYSLPVNFPSQNHAIHGFMHNKEFLIKKTSVSGMASIALECLYNKGIAGFPFDFLTRIEYCLSDEGFSANIIIQNLGEEDIPLSVGWHPYFTLGEPIDNLYLKIPNGRMITPDDRMIPTGKYAPLKRFTKLSKIGKAKLDAGFKISKYRTILCSKKNKITLTVWQDAKKYNYLQIFIPKSRKSIAIEPMTSNTDAFNSGEGLIILKPKKSFSGSYGVYLE